MPDPEVKVLVYKNTYHILVDGKDVYWRTGLDPANHNKTVSMFNAMAIVIVQAFNAIGLRPKLITWQ